MRVIVKHNKTQEEAMRSIDRASEDLVQGLVSGPVKITDQRKRWNGNVMDFAFTGRMGFFSAPVSGTVTVGPQDVTIDVELPEIVKRFMPEEKIRQTVENRAERLLA